MLDKIRGRVDDTRNKDLIVGNFDRLEIFPFVIVARISGLDADCLRPCFESDINNLYQRQIVGVRTFVIARTDVQPHAVSGKACGRGVEQRNIAFGNFAEELIVGEMSILVVSRRGEIGSVYLQQEARSHNGAIFGLHHVGEGGFMAAEEAGDADDARAPDERGHRADKLSLTACRDDGELIAVTERAPPFRQPSVEEEWARTGG